MVEMIDALYAATNSPLVMAVVTAIFASTATLLAFMAVIERQPTWSWMSIFLFILASTAMFFSLVRTEPDRDTVHCVQRVELVAAGKEEKRVGEMMSAPGETWGALFVG